MFTHGYYSAGDGGKEKGSYDAITGCNVPHRCEVIKASQDSLTEQLEFHAGQDDDEE